VEARTAFLRQRIEAERPSAERWMRTWGVVDGALTVGQLVAVPFTPDRSSRTVLLAGAATSALGVLQILLVPPVARSPPAADRAEDACAEVAALERALARDARNQTLGAGWIAHAGNLLVNGAIGLAAGLAGERWRSGALTFAIGFALGEAQILTQPTGLARDLERYRGGNVGLTAEAPPPIALAAGGVVSIQVTF